ncbi:MAG: hypothetical protein RMI49_04135 [Candidatus Caldarchaeum sp.]|nr:hypothetical protein [Candidatus Caldarchaeum sp.]
MRDEDLEKAILERDKTIDRNELERMVEEKLRSSPFLTRRGALLIILEERRIAAELLEERNYDEYISLDRLTAGLQNVSVAGVVIGMKSVKSETSQPYVTIRLADGSGSVDVFSDRLDLFTGISVGDPVGVKNCYVSSSRRRKRLIIRAGSRTVVERLANRQSWPPFERLFTQPSEALSKGLDHVDFTAVVVYDTGLRRNDVDYNLVVVTDGEKPYLLHAYRENAEVFLSSSSRRFYATNVLVRGEEFHTSSDTCVIFSDQEPEKSNKALSMASEVFVFKVLGASIDGTVVGVGGGKIFRFPLGKGFPFGTYVEARNSFIIASRGVPHLIAEKFSTVEVDAGDFEPRLFEGLLDNVEGRIVDSVLQAEVSRKTELSYVETRFGVKEFIQFWLKVGGKIYSGSAWGEAARKLSEVSEKSSLRLAFVSVKRNRFGESEIVVDRITAFC